MSEQQQRMIDLSVEVPGTPEQVWLAIATGPGISSWFVPHDVAEREGGKVTMDFGPYGQETAGHRVGASAPSHLSPAAGSARSPTSGWSKPKTAAPASYGWSTAASGPELSGTPTTTP